MCTRLKAIFVVCIGNQSQKSQKGAHLCSASISTPTDVDADSVEYIIEPNILTSFSSMSREMLKCLNTTGNLAMDPQTTEL